MYTVRMPFATRRTWRRWRPVWIGFVVCPPTSVVGLYLRILATAIVVEWRQP
jgi:hypothetical protein